LVQAGDTSQMLYSIPEIIVYLQQRYGLKKGDIIYTGTPQGVGRLCAGDQLTLRLESDLLVAHFLIG
ncbi:MAG: fumarylacetoacetate hydrolase family protein, partial [Neisseriaceae bacterium]